jgi:hypothetical protein
VLEPGSHLAAGDGRPPAITQPASELACSDARSRGADPLNRRIDLARSVRVVFFAGGVAGPRALRDAD